MSEQTSHIRQLENEICRLQQENSRLRLLLDQAGICYEQTTQKEDVQETVAPVPITEAHAALLYSVFKGRKDVFSRREFGRMAARRTSRNAIISGKRGFVPSRPD